MNPINKIREASGVAIIFDKKENGVHWQKNKIEIGNVNASIEKLKKQDSTILFNGNLKLKTTILFIKFI